MKETDAAALIKIHAEMVQYIKSLRQSEKYFENTKAVYGEWAVEEARQMADYN